MMSRPDARAAWTALAALWATTGAQAQDVHKCMVNGQVVYQAQSCAGADTVLPQAPTPSDQESRQARNELSRQRMQAATGRLYRPAYVPPPPPPPPPPVFLPPSTTTTTITVVPESGKGSVTIRQTTHTPGRVVYSPPQKPLTNCEKLDRDNGELIDRRDQLRAPGELASREEMLRKAEADLAHVKDMARAGNCRLTR